MPKMILDELRTYSGQPVRKSENGFEKTFAIPKSFTGFQGHFPGHPVLPAIAQPMLAQVAIEEHMGQGVRVLNVNRAKFLHVVVPDSVITVRCQERSGGSSGKFKCKLEVGETVVSTFGLAVMADHG